MPLAPNDREVVHQLPRSGRPVASEKAVTRLYRRHARSMTRAGDYQLLEVLQKSLDRRRRAAGDGRARPLPKLEDLDGAR